MSEVSREYKKKCDVCDKVFVSTHGNFPELTCVGVYQITNKHLLVLPPMQEFDACHDCLPPRGSSSPFNAKKFFVKMIRKGTS